MSSGNKWPASPSLKRSLKSCHISVSKYIVLILYLQLASLRVLKRKFNGLTYYFINSLLFVVIIHELDVSIIRHSFFYFLEINVLSWGG
jgi:hypothetical protein